MFFCLSQLGNENDALRKNDEQHDVVEKKNNESYTFFHHFPPETRKEITHKPPPN